MLTFLIDSRLRALRGSLREHPLHCTLRPPYDVRTFIAPHVICVWDFMSLHKALQRRLTCVELPWLPPAHPDSCRLVNEILLGKESDSNGAGGYRSHFEL